MLRRWKHVFSFFFLFTHWCRMLEAPFRPREKLFEKQKYFQSIHKHTYLKGPMDKITSVAIPAALAATSIFLIVSTCLLLPDFAFGVFIVCDKFWCIVDFVNFFVHSIQARGIYNLSHGIGKKEWQGDLCSRRAHLATQILSSMLSEFEWFCSWSF